MGFNCTCTTVLYLYVTVLHRVRSRARSKSGSPQNPLRSWIPQSLLHSGSLQSPLNKPLLSSGGYLLHPGGILLCWSRPGLLLCSACPALAPLSAYSSGPTSTPRAWSTVPTPDLPPAHPSRHFSVFVFGASGIRSLRGDCVTVLLVCPDRPPDISVCWTHGLLFVVGATCLPVYYLSP